MTVSALKLDVDYLQQQCDNNPIPSPLVCVHRDQLRLLLDEYRKKKGIILDDAINEVVSDLSSIIEKVKALKDS